MNTTSPGVRGKSAILLLLLAATIIASEPYWIYLTDKGHGRSADLLTVSALTAERRLVSKLGAAAGFEDIPPHPSYLRLIEISGGLIRTRSRWLNAASVRLPFSDAQVDSSILLSLQKMPFVKAITPVATQVQEFPVNQTLGKEPIEPKHYGSTYAQLALLNVPQVHNLGIFGEGARIGFLDSGFKRDHTVFRTVRLQAEHDFVTGDDVMLQKSTTADPTVQNYEMVQQPELHTDRLFFIADSTDRNAATVRVLYAARREGNVWTIIPLSNARMTTTEGIVRSYAMDSRADTTLVVWESGSTSNYKLRQLRYSVLTPEGLTDSEYLQGTTSRNPFLISEDDTTSLLFYVMNDGEIRMNRAVWNETTVSWSGDSDVFTPGGILDQPKATISGDTLIVAALDLTTGSLHLTRSLDRGQSFSLISSPVDEEVVAFDMDGNYLIVAFADTDAGGFRLASYETTDAGLSWTGAAHEEVYSTIGSLDLLALGGGGLQVVFESAGEVFLTSSSGDITSWNIPSSLAAEFCYQPHLSFNADEVEVIWTMRGDDNTDYDPDEDGYDIAGNSQPAHGSRTAALAVGYQGRFYIGSAPAAQLYVAKTEKHINRYGSSYEMRIEEDTWVQGLEWLERSGVDIVNSSLAYGDWYSNDELDGQTSPASRAATMAANRGMLVVNAAGNVKSSVSYVKPPADAYGILTVGGVDTLGNWWEQGLKTSGSAVGLPDDGRIKPELVAPASGVYVIDVDDTISRYYYGNGTSYAAPLVAGIAALMLQVHPEYRGNPDTIISILQQSASNYSSPNDTMGYGIPDAYQAILPLPDDIDTFSRNELLAPYPNPFHPGSQDCVYFPFRLNKASTRITLRIFTLSGELVCEKSLAPMQAVNPDDDEIPIGTYEDAAELTQMGAYWDGLAANSQRAASGLYLVVLSTQYGHHTGKFVLMR